VIVKLFINLYSIIFLLDIKDIEKHFPGLLKATVEWLKIYKIPDGKPENKFAFNGEPKNAEFALKIISDAHEYWKGLVQKENSEELSWYKYIMLVS
jgi:nucleosome-remodeling factor subunit